MPGFFCAQKHVNMSREFLKRENEKEANMGKIENGKKLYRVETHLGVEETWATSARKAMSNVKFRLFGTAFTTLTRNWRAVEVRHA